jgi:hypothetical protein
VHEAFVHLPSDISLAVAIEDADGLRRSPVGKPVQKIVEDLISVAQARELSDAWGALSRQMGLTGAALFDRLLGNRAVYLRRDTNDGSRGWALLLETDSKTERLIRKGLKPAPRQPVDGRQILAVEDGRFLMATLGNPGAADRVRVLLAPSSARELFLSLVTSRPAAGERLSQTDRANRLRALDASPSLAVVSLMGDRSVSLVGRVEGRRLSLSFDARLDGVVANDAPEPWSRSLFDRLSRDARFAAMEHDTDSWLRMLGQLEMPKALPTLFGEFNGHEFIGKKRASVIRETPRGKAEMTVAIETSDPEALAPHADDFMAGFLARTGYADAGGLETLDFQGLHPAAIRRISSDRTTPFDAMGVFESPVEFAWCMRGDALLPEGHAWWISGTNLEGVRTLAAHLQGQGEGTAGEGVRAPWVMLARGNTAALARLFAPIFKALTAAQPDAVGIIAAIQRAGLVEIEVKQIGPGQFRGTVGVRFDGAE